VPGSEIGIDIAVSFSAKVQVGNGNVVQAIPLISHNMFTEKGSALSRKFFPFLTFRTFGTMQLRLDIADFLDDAGADRNVFIDDRVSVKLYSTIIHRLKSMHEYSYATSTSFVSVGAVCKTTKALSAMVDNLHNITHGNLAHIGIPIPPPPAAAALQRRSASALLDAVRASAAVPVSAARSNNNVSLSNVCRESARVRDSTSAPEERESELGDPHEASPAPAKGPRTRAALHKAECAAPHSAASTQVPHQER